MLAGVGADFDFGHVGFAGPGGAGDLVRFAGRQGFVLGRAGDLRLHLHGRDRHQTGQAVRAIEEGIIERLEEAAERLLDHKDAREPFHRRHAVPAADDDAQREAVGGRQFLAIHAPGEQYLGLAGLVERQTSGKRNRAGRLRVGDRSGVGAFQHDLDGRFLDFGQIQNRGEGHAGPLGIADGAELPIHALGGGGEEHPAIAGTFERHRH